MASLLKTSGMQVSLKNLNEKSGYQTDYKMTIYSATWHGFIKKNNWKY